MSEDSASENSGTTVVTVKGEANEGNPDTYTLDISLPDDQWRGHEPLGASRILAFKAGEWTVTAGKTVFTNNAGLFVIELLNFNPGTTPAGRSGTGRATQNGVARTVTWRRTP